VPGEPVLLLSLSSGAQYVYFADFYPGQKPERCAKIEIMSGGGWNLVIKPAYQTALLYSALFLRPGWNSGHSLGRLQGISWQILFYWL
jgi:hypothetical protein